MTTSTGFVELDRRGELDPLGSDAGAFNPNIQPRQWPGEDMTYPAFADMMSGDCTLAGVSAPCEMVMSMLHHGSAYIMEPGELINARVPKTPKKGPMPTLKKRDPSDDKRTNHSQPKERKVTTTVTNRGGIIIITNTVSDSEGEMSSSYEMNSNELIPQDTGLTNPAKIEKTGPGCNIAVSFKGSYPGAGPAEGMPNGPGTIKWEDGITRFGRERVEGGSPFRTRCVRQPVHSRIHRNS